MTGAIDGEILSTHNFFQDAFGIGVVHNTRNKLDLPSTYDFNTERYLLYVNGSRVEPGSTAFTNHFTDQESRYDLEPDAGDTVELRVRERPRYVPGFEILNGTAWYMSSQLPSGGVVRVGLRDPGENSFTVEYEADACYGQITKGGTQTVRTELTDGFMANREISYQDKLQQPSINRSLVNMYGVGNFKPGISYLFPPEDVGNLSLGVDEANAQANENMLANHINANGGQVTQDVGLGNLSSVNTEEFNMHMSIEIDLSNAATGATLSALSQQYVVLGNVEPTTRPKPFTFFDLGGGIGAGWNDDVVALRTDPTQENIDCDLTGLGVTPSGGTVEVVAMAFDPDTLSFTDGNFVPVQEQALRGGENTVLQANIQDCPMGYPTQTYTDPKGNSVTVPAGRILARSTEAASGGGGPPGSNQSEGERTETKRTIFNDDVILLIPRGAPGASGVSLDVLDGNTDQDW